jgi:predicted DsbA family dithiol-disulfide isomerase
VALQAIIPRMSVPAPLSIDVSFDLICPWCLIGKRHLETAITQLRVEQPDVDVTVEWRSVPLIPDTPLEGLPYRDFYVARLGSPAAVAARQSQVLDAALHAGLELALTRIETFPNTLLAHRLVRFARLEAGPAAAAALIENLFTRYFTGAENIGDPQVLRAALDACGIATPGLPETPLSHDLPWLPPLQDVVHRGGTGVPFFVVDGKLGVSGAVPPAVLVQAMQRALAQRQVPA